MVTLGKGLGQEEFSYLGVVTLDGGLGHFSWSGRDLAERGYFLRVGARERALVAYVFLLLPRMIRMMIRNKRIEHYPNEIYSIKFYIRWQKKIFPRFSSLHFNQI